MTRAVYIWQRTLSPHFTGFARHLACHGIETVLVYNHALDPARVNIGWSEERPDHIAIVHASDRRAVEKAVNSSPKGAVHIVQGLARNGLVGHATRCLRRARARIWVSMETLDDAGLNGCLRRIEYRLRLLFVRHSIERFLAIGRKTPAWLAARGVDARRISPFTYFLPGRQDIPMAPAEAGPVRLLCVGQLIERKRVNDIVAAVASLSASAAELTIIGDGPLRSELENQAKVLLPGRVWFLGVMPIRDIRGVMRAHDVLILASRHDGWGAVVSEALIEGMRVVCSDRCGASVAAIASPAGRIYPARDVAALASALADMAALGRVSPIERQATAKWAECLTVEAGAAYVAALLQDPKTSTPWASQHV